MFAGDSGCVIVVVVCWMCCWRGIESSRGRERAKGKSRERERVKRRDTGEGKKKKGEIVGPNDSQYKIIKDETVKYLPKRKNTKIQE